MNKVAVRQAALSDLDALAALFDRYRQFYGRGSDVDAAKAFLLARFNHGESVLFLAFDGDMPVGFAQLYPSFSSVSLARIFVLNDLFVDTSARKQGVAGKLIAAAVAFAKTVGAVRLSLSTEVGNKSAQALYEANGWKRDEAFLSYEFSVPL
ncbi:GNAT family N-acetyltransferase [Simplicispira suum]|uniref:GNAT family N-acetyltransferase n=1 Tax=Simplicispira suum TaxID=2109915 RepID=A0A2S0MWZ3_9BURK|nr:GNAT family N-acetyltransferase [Simplicispira suum]AVO40405.1 GNAT family N-acetyltransferase [Simplicispira suum]